MPLPDIVIAGAPKCGTSSFFSWLVDHPGVCGSRVKETFYLMDGDHPLARAENYHRQGLDGYRAFFSDCRSPGARTAEATTHYISQATAPRVLADLHPQPDVVFLLRDPAERIYSSFQYTRNNLSSLRADATFAEFLAIGEPGGDRIVAHAGALPSVPLWAAEVELSRYVVHLRAWAALFPRDRLHVYLFEDLRRDPRALMARAAADLRIDPGFYADYAFPRRNESYAVRSQPLQRLGRRMGRRLPGPLRALLRAGYLRALTRPPAPRSPEDRALIARLRDAFRPYNEQLQAEFGVDVSPWSRPA